MLTCSTIGFENISTVVNVKGALFVPTADQSSIDMKSWYQFAIHEKLF